MLKAANCGQHLGASVLRVLLGFAVGATIGGALGLRGLNPRGEAFVDPSVQAVRSVPLWRGALAPLWMGIGEAPKITLIAMWGPSFPFISRPSPVCEHGSEARGSSARIHGLGRFAIGSRRHFSEQPPSMLHRASHGLAVAWLYVFAAIDGRARGLVFF